jgi:hypothetical protein
MRNGSGQKNLDDGVVLLDAFHVEPLELHYRLHLPLERAQLPQLACSSNGHDV